MNSTNEAKTNSKDNTTATSSPAKETNLYLAQTKIPSEMLAPYIAPSEFESFGYEFQYIGYDPSQAMMPQLSPYYPYQTHYYDPYFGGTASYTKDFPRAQDYTSEDAILEVFPHLEGLNDTDFDVAKVSPNAHFYILRSSNDDNIHKAIKYHIWSSTPNGKNSLKKAWESFEETNEKPEIYFLFTVVNSNQFLGVAKMMSNVNVEDSFKYWWEPCKWFGTFQMQWLFIKDIHYSYFEHIREEGHPTSVVNLRDGTKISAESGKEILNVFKSHPVELNIFASFEYMDRREDCIRTQRDNDPEFQQLFEQCCTSNQSMQESFYSQRKQYYYRQNGRKSNGYRKYSHNPLGSANNYFPKNLYHKKSEDRIHLSQEEFPSIQQSDERLNNAQQTRKYSGGQNYRKRNQSFRSFNNGYRDPQKNYNNDKLYQEKNNSNITEIEVKERDRITENESNGGQGKQDEYEVQQESQEKAYGDHSQLC